MFVYLSILAFHRRSGSSQPCIAPALLISRHHQYRCLSKWRKLAMQPHCPPDCLSNTRSPSSYQSTFLCNILFATVGQTLTHLHYYTYKCCCPSECRHHSFHVTLCSNVESQKHLLPCGPLLTWCPTVLVLSHSRHPTPRAADANNQSCRVEASSINVSEPNLKLDTTNGQ